MELEPNEPQPGLCNIELPGFRLGGKPVYCTIPLRAFGRPHSEPYHALRTPDGRDVIQCR